MYCTRNVSDSVVWVGASDRRLALFENLFPIPRGVSYNSYLILDEKTALLDTTDASVTRQYLENVSHSLNGKPLDYLIINHMEPDHCANIAELLLRYPHLTLVGNAKTFAFVSQFYDLDLTGRTLTVKEGDTLCLGSHTLHFFLAPMVHWPEVMVTYEETEQILFSADAFGSFGALNGHLFADEVNFDRDYRFWKIVYKHVVAHELSHPLALPNDVITGPFLPCLFFLPSWRLCARFMLYLLVIAFTWPFILPDSEETIPKASMQIARLFLPLNSFSAVPSPNTSSKNSFTISHIFRMPSAFESSVCFLTSSALFTTLSMDFS